MKLAFSGQGRYPDYTQGYELYRRRAKKEAMGEKMYARIIRTYCSSLADRLCQDGIVDLPNGFGSISAAMIKRRPKYRDGKFVGYGKMDYDKGHLDGSMKAFGLVYLPQHGKNDNLRCFGYVANRRLFKRMKALYENGDCDWVPMSFNEEMI